MITINQSSIVRLPRQNVPQEQPQAATSTLPGSSAQVFAFVDPGLTRSAPAPLRSREPNRVEDALDALGQSAVQIRPPASPAQQRLLDELVGALQEDRLQVYFQTQHDLATGHVTGCEALLRLSDAAGELLDTQTLIELAEAFDLIVLVGRQFMRKALHEFAALRSEGLMQGVLAINMSPLELAHPGYATALLDAVATAGLRPSDLELEVTESRPLEDPRLLLEQLERLAAAGVGLAVDDFGTGYAGWHTIARLPVRAVKLDRSLVARLSQCNRAKTLVRHLAVSGEELGFELVAEGIENPVQLQQLAELGCRRGQGYYLGLPQPASAYRRENS